MTCDLSDHRCYRWRKFEGAIFDKEATNSTKVDRPKKVFNIDIEDKPTAAVNFRIGDNGSPFLKTMVSIGVEL